MNKMKILKGISIFVIVFIIGYVFVSSLIYFVSLVKYKAYKIGYETACKDFYKGHLRMDLIENEDGTREWKQVSADHHKRRGCIGQCDEFGHCKLNAWDDKNYFEGHKIAVIEQLNRWNAEDYYEVKRLSCPKCGSFNIMENGQRGRTVILSFRCKDCGHVWERHLVGFFNSSHRKQRGRTAPNRAL